MSLIDGKKLRDSAWKEGRESRWHFEQAVLKNMKGAAGDDWTKWVHDFGMGGDMVGEIMEGPRPGQRMELELANRLGAGKSIW
ncbi:uncharacterized protein BDV17DRAFT_263606 [Aspergillus undulatus]|uniref:uncharacterized protein n=1 Tax=Aspergillus undulatus TaxID=1810928 RepID=UPI003CCD470D